MSAMLCIDDVVRWLDDLHVRFGWLFCSADKDADKDDDEDADEACRIIFAYVSAMFIEDPLLLKCVHFQVCGGGM